MTANGAHPPYQQVVQDIRAKIKSGHYPLGGRLPSQRAISDEYGIAPMTAMKALQALCDDGWAYSVPSTGTFVAESLPSGEESSGSLKEEVDNLRSVVNDLVQRVQRIENAVDR
ncbi:GntR family transcriptional regulator [Nocardia nova]|uniref:GntR family transcriptional regulator n=1 Tax=Nocardia nova TaxID=37330 RepID=UPI0009DD5EF1|nr:winged helix-turn-helix domain-containing protein [Nocardia nova]